MKKDSLNTKRKLIVGQREYSYYSLEEASKTLGKDLSRLPYSLKVLLENLLRMENGVTVTAKDIETLASWVENNNTNYEIYFMPARVLMQDFTGVPAVVDLAAMRFAIEKLGGNPKLINPLAPVDLVIDHSVQVDKYGNPTAFKENVDLEMKRNMERYEFLRWGQKAFNNFRVVPPGTGICHQVNLEFLAQCVWTKEEEGEVFAYPDTLVGTDSHTTMINGLGVLGWGVGGIEAEAVMLGQPMSMLIPEVIGFKLEGNLKEGTTATDLVLTVTKMLREKGVVNKFVEFYGPGLNSLSLADRATIANMAPEYGATCGFFPIDSETINYLKLSNRDSARIDLVEQYAKAQGLWRDQNSPDPIFTSSLELNLSEVEPSLAGPKRPQDRVSLANVSQEFEKALPGLSGAEQELHKSAAVKGENFEIATGHVTIAAITSCTNTSNPSVMMAAGLIAKKAAEKGLKAKPWVKTSIAPGSKVVSEYLEKSGLQKYLDQIGFNLVGYGCTTCIGNSGPLKAEIEETISANNLVVSAVLSGNRNFEGRVHPLVKANYLASPPLVVAFALAGSMTIDITEDPIGQDQDGNYVYLRDIWPSNKEIADAINNTIDNKMFKEKYEDVFAGDETWQAIKTEASMLYNWDEKSTYIANPPYFEGMSKNAGSISDVKGAKLLALFGDSITTDHISPAGNISKTSPAAKYLMDRGVAKEDFNSYGARRGHHEVMMRGTFANIRIKNELLGGIEGGFTKVAGSDEAVSIYEAAMEYKKNNTPLIIVAGKEYGTGSSRDWAAKGTFLLGIKAVIAESFERIHRSNLVRMGVVPFVFTDNMTRKDLNLTGKEIFDISFKGEVTPKMLVDCKITYEDGSSKTIKLLTRIDTVDEVEFMKHGGILQYVIRNCL